MSFVRNNLRRLRDFFRFISLFRKRGELYSVSNGNILAQIEQDNVYKMLEKQYAEIIEQGVDLSNNGSRSNKIWICWFQGEENAPDIVKACINSVRKNLPEKEVIVLSEDTISKYVQFPEYIDEKWKNRIISPAHYSDLLRLELLCKYGGMWIDATVLCTSSDVPSAISESPLFVYQKVDLIRRDRDAIIASSWFISAWSNQRILLLTRALLYEYWKTHEQLDNYYLYHICFAIAARRYTDDWKSVPVYNNQSPHVLQFELGERYSEIRWKEIQNMSVFHKLNRRMNYSNLNDSFYGYIIDKFLS